jgi:hypothetical protein
MDKKFGKAGKTGWKDVVIRDENEQLFDDNGIPMMDEPDL